MRLSIALAAALLIANTNVRAQEADCSTTLDLFAYLKRAQHQCGFKTFNEYLASEAGACLRKVAKPSYAAILLRSSRRFDSAANARGLMPECRKLLSDYSDYVSE